MPMTVIITQNVPSRTRGFLASVALEIAPGVYTAPRMSTAVRERIWKVLTDWQSHYPQGSVLITWRALGTPGNQRIMTLGMPSKTIVDLDGILVVRSD